jgi:hypothetical protein
MSHDDSDRLGPKRTWTEEDWAEYRRLPWVSRRVTDILVLAPKLARRLAPLIMRFEEELERRRYARDRRDASRERGAVRHRTPASRRGKR